jgi:hypothetical protein
MSSGPSYPRRSRLSIPIRTATKPPPDRPLRLSSSTSRSSLRCLTPKRWDIKGSFPSCLLSYLPTSIIQSLSSLFALPPPFLSPSSLPTTLHPLKTLPPLHPTQPPCSPLLSSLLSLPPSLPLMSRCAFFFRPSLFLTSFLC